MCTLMMGVGGLLMNDKAGEAKTVLVAIFSDARALYKFAFTQRPSFSSPA